MSLYCNEGMSIWLLTEWVLRRGCFLEECMHISNTNNKI